MEFVVILWVVILWVVNHVFEGITWETRCNQRVAANTCKFGV